MAETADQDHPAPAGDGDRPRNESPRAIHSSRSQSSRVIVIPTLAGIPPDAASASEGIRELQGRRQTLDPTGRKGGQRQSQRRPLPAAAPTAPYFIYAPFHQRQQYQQERQRYQPRHSGGRAKLSCASGPWGAFAGWYRSNGIVSILRLESEGKPAPSTRAGCSRTTGLLPQEALPCRSLPSIRRPRSAPSIRAALRGLAVPAAGLRICKPPSF
jgi:hypothetical protein